MAHNNQNPSDINSDFNVFIKNNIRTLAEGIKISNTLPIGSDRNNFVTCFPNFQKEILPHGDKLTQLMSLVLKKEGFKTDIANRDAEEKVDLVVDGVNKILDRVTDHLNELKGLKKMPIYTKPNDSENYGSWNKTKNDNIDDFEKEALNFSEKQHINKFDQIKKRPQDSFKDKIDNSKEPFRPKISHKPNSVEPLKLFLETDKHGNEMYNHPYETELDQWKTPEHLLQERAPIHPLNFEKTKALFVKSVGQLKNMMDHLKQQKEIAVDLEHHDRRSYLGFTCLIQISSREQDYIVDSLALRSELHVLNEIFTNPSIVKVFHGAQSDVQWLQKDFGVYIVNLFDTYIAGQLLGFPQLSLKYLLNQYCNVNKLKKFVFYDWRTRPISQGAYQYARSDTHYSLYLYDVLTNLLMERGGRNLVEKCFARGVEICKKRFYKPFDERGVKNLLKHASGALNNRSRYALENLYLLRDEIAREEDESANFILPNNVLVRLAEQLPIEPQVFLQQYQIAIAKNPQYTDQIRDVIKKAMNMPLTERPNRIPLFGVKPLIMESQSVTKRSQRIHDFSHHPDFRNDLSTLLDGTEVVEIQEQDQKCSLTILWKNFDEHLREKAKVQMKFVSPYERYTRTMQFENEKPSENSSDTDLKRKKPKKERA